MVGSGEPGSLVGIVWSCPNRHALPFSPSEPPSPGPTSHSSKSCAVMSPHIPLPSAWRREALRTNLWLVPVVEIVLAVALFVGTYALDRVRTTARCSCRRS